MKLLDAVDQVRSASGPMSAAQIPIARRNELPGRVRALLSGSAFCCVLCPVLCLLASSVIIRRTSREAEIRAVPDEEGRRLFLTKKIDRPHQGSLMRLPIRATGSELAAVAL